MTTALLEKDIERYLKKVSRHLVGPAKERRRLLELLRGNIAEYVSQHPAAEIDDVIVHFGEPRTLAYSMIEGMSPAQIRRTIQKYTWLKILAAAITIILVGALLCFAVERIAYAVHGNPIVIIEQPVEVTSIPSYFVRKLQV